MEYRLCAAYAHEHDSDRYHHDHDSYEYDPFLDSYDDHIWGDYDYTSIEIGKFFHYLSVFMSFLLNCVHF